MSLRDWIDIDNIDWFELSSNPSAVDMLMENPKEINWFNLSGNPEAIEIIKANMDMVGWSQLSFNPNAIDILIANKDKIWRNQFCENPASVEFIELRKYANIVAWNAKATEVLGIPSEELKPMEYAFLMSNPNAIGFIEHLLKHNRNKVEFARVCKNPSAKHIIEAGLARDPRHRFISWGAINRNPAMFDTLMQMPEKINWHALSMNPSAIEFLEMNKDKVDWDSLSANPAIFDSAIVLK